MLDPTSYPLPGGIARMGSRIYVYFDGTVTLRTFMMRLYQQVTALMFIGTALILSSTAAYM